MLYPPTFGWPSPSSSSNDWMAELSAAVQRNGPSGGANHNDIDLNETNSQIICPDTNPKHILAKDTSDEAKGRLMLEKLTKYPHLRKSLNSLNIARAYKYGAKSFGKMSWYTENFHIGRGLKSNVERRKFRFGLKSNIDFLLQLDLANLKTCLLDKSQDNHFPQPTSTSSLSDGSFLNLMQKMNLTKSQEFCKIFNRLESNLKFTQSLSDYFANDDMLEPASLVISDALRQSPDLGKGLWGRSVAANALLYRQRASTNDREFNSGRQNHRNDRNPPRNPTRYRRGDFERTRTPYQHAFSPKYPKGSCFRFQAKGYCNDKECTFDHACCKCFSKEHGKDTCPDN